MIEIDGSLFSPEDPALGEVLGRAHSARIRPLCCCQQPGVEMYIARFGDEFLVKRMPNSGHRHNVRCASFDPPAYMSGIAQLLGSAIQSDDARGVTDLKFGFALSKHRPGAESRRNPKESAATSVKRTVQRMSLRAVLHYLLDQAGLNRWSPAPGEKRHWESVRMKLLLAAVGNVASGKPLEHLLHIPEPFSLSDKVGIAQRRQRLYSQLASASVGAIPLMLLIGEVRGFGDGKIGKQMLVKHMPEAPFELPGDLYLRIQRRFESELMLWNAVEASRLLVVATFEVGRTGVASIAELALVVMDRHWLGFGSIEEKVLIDTLIDQQRCFIKPLQYDAGPEQDMPTAVLLDAGEPVPLRIASVKRDASDNLKCGFEPGAAETRWEWVSAEAMPMLPAAAAETEPQVTPVRPLGRSMP